MVLVIEEPPARLDGPLHGDFTEAGNTANPYLPVFFLGPLTDATKNHTFNLLSNFRIGYFVRLD